MCDEQNKPVRSRDEDYDLRCIEKYSILMREKMKFSRDVKGRKGWQDLSTDDLSQMLREHVEKGDPVDVANFCMMLAAKRAPIPEARGAAEQRRKDGEEPVAWENPETRSLQYATPIYSTQGSVYFHPGWRPLYTRPANVAALEARIAELENSALDAIALIRNGRPVLARTALQRVTPGLEPGAVKVTERSDPQLITWLTSTPAFEVRPEHQDAIRLAVNAAMDSHEADTVAKAENNDKA